MNRTRAKHRWLLQKVRIIWIKDKAKEYHIEIVENKPLARILYHNVDIGMEIPPELYQVVAEILARVLQPGKQKTMLL